MGIMLKNDRKIFTIYIRSGAKISILKQTMFDIGQNENNLFLFPILQLTDHQFCVNPRYRLNSKLSKIYSPLLPIRTDVRDVNLWNRKSKTSFIRTTDALADDCSRNLAPLTSFENKVLYWVYLVTHDVNIKHEKIALLECDLENNWIILIYACRLLPYHIISSY